MKTTEIMELNDDERVQKEKELREELFNLKFQHAIGKLENTSRLRTIRKDIARILTMQSGIVSKKG